MLTIMGKCFPFHFCVYSVSEILLLLVWNLTCIQDEGAVNSVVDTVNSLD